MGQYPEILSFSFLSDHRLISEEIDQHLGSQSHQGEELLAHVPRWLNELSGLQLTEEGQEEEEEVVMVVQ